MIKKLILTFAFVAILFGGWYQANCQIGPQADDRLIIERNVTGYETFFPDALRLTSVPKTRYLYFRIDRIRKGTKLSNYARIRYDYWSESQELPNDIYKGHPVIRADLVRHENCDIRWSDLISKEQTAEQEGRRQLIRVSESDFEKLPPDTLFPCYMLRPGKIKLIG